MEREKKSVEKRMEREREKECRKEDGLRERKRV